MSNNKRETIPDGVYFRVAPEKLPKQDMISVIGNRILNCLWNTDGEICRQAYIYECKDGRIRVRTPGQWGQLPYRLDNKSLWIGIVEYRLYGD